MSLHPRPRSMKQERRDLAQIRQMRQQLSDLEDRRMLTAGQIAFAKAAMLRIEHKWDCRRAVRAERQRFRRRERRANQRLRRFMERLPRKINELMEKIRAVRLSVEVSDRVEPAPIAREDLPE